MSEDDAFVPLAALVRASAAPALEPPPASPLPPESMPRDVTAALHAARRFTAAVREAVDEMRATLLLDVASAILARELELAPADLEAIVARALARFSESEPVRVRVHPSELRIDPGIPVVADPSLHPADAVVELRCGEIDARLGMRLRELLDGWSV